MTSTKYLTIRSQDRVSGDRSNFTIQTPTMKEKTQIHLRAASIPNTWYTFENQTVIVTTGVPNNVVLNGSFNITDLVSAYNAVVPGLASYNFVTQRLRFSGGALASVVFPNLETARRHGFDAVNNVGTPLTANRPVDLLRYKFISIYISQYGSTGQSAAETYHSYTYRLIVDVPRDANIIYYSEAKHYNDTNIRLPESHGLINVKLLGDDGIPILDAHLNDWSFDMEYDS